MLKNKKTIAFFLLVVTSLIWGGAYPLLNYIIEKNEISILMINAIRFGSGFLVLFPFSLFQIKKLRKRDLLISVCSGIVLFFAFWLLTLSISDGTPGITSMLLNASVFLVPLLTAITDKKWPKAYIFIGTAIIFVGFILLSLKDEFNILNTKFELSIFYAFASALLFSFQMFIIGKYHTNKDTSCCITSIQLLVVSVLFVIFSLIFDGFGSIGNVSANTIISLLILGIFASGLAYYFQSKASVVVSENFCNIILSLESFFAYIISVIIGYDNLTLISSLAIIVIAVGISFFIYMDLKEKSYEDKIIQDNKKTDDNCQSGNNKNQ